MVYEHLDNLLAQRKEYEATQVVNSNSIRLLKKEGVIKAADYIMACLEKFIAYLDSVPYVIFTEQLWWLRTYISNRDEMKVLMDKIKHILFKVVSVEWTTAFDEFVYKIINQMDPDYADEAKSFRIFLFRLYRTDENFLNARLHLRFLNNEKEIYDFLIEFIQRECEPEEKNILFLQVFMQCFDTLKMEKTKALFNLYMGQFENGIQSPPYSEPIFNFIYYIIQAIEQGNSNDFVTIYKAYKPILLQSDPLIYKDINSFYRKIFPRGTAAAHPNLDSERTNNFLQGITNIIFQGRRTQQPNRPTDIDID